MSDSHNLEATLQWHIDAGCDETVGEVPVNRLQPPVDNAPAAAMPPADERPAPSPPARTGVTRGAKVDPKELDNNKQLQSAVEIAAGARDLAALRQALETFDGCPLKKTATNLVFVDGTEDADVVFVGEAPGAEEDRQGLPFVGPSGRLLNAMLESIGLAREDVLISNTVFWRPPGNRTPTTQEAAVCKPFIERVVELADPKVLVCVGAPAAHTMLGEKQGISRLRGKWFTFQTPGFSHPVAATALFHPAYLLRTPIKKRDAWHDLRMIRAKLAE